MSVLVPSGHRPVVVGAVLWLLVMLALLGDYPGAPLSLVGISLTYPAFYCWLSWRLARRA